MSARHRNLSVILGLAFIACALAVWGFRSMRGGGVSEQSLRDTAGIEARMIGVRPVQQGVAVGCVIENQTARQAGSVVFVVRLEDKQGRMLAANPLGNVLELKPHESRAVRLFVPIEGVLPDFYKPVIEVSLVRWGQ